MVKWFNLNGFHFIARHHFKQTQTIVLLFGYLGYFIPKISILTFHKQTILMRQNKIFTNTQQTILLPGGGGGGGGAACNIKHRRSTQRDRQK